MQYLKDQGFIIRRVNFGDSDRFLTLFTQNHGKIEVVAKGVRKITSRRGGAIELLNLIEFQTVKSAKNRILTEVQLISSNDHLKKELKHIEKVFLMCELVDAFMPEGTAHADVFDLMVRALAHVTTDEKTLTYFQARLLSILGFWDHQVSFKNAEHVTNMVEQVMERKLKTNGIFTA